MIASKGPENDERPAGRAGTRKTLLEALSELSGVLGDIVATAEETSCRRCPYMNLRRECTAAFSCINQVFRRNHARPLCSGEHKIRSPAAGA